MFQFHCDQCHNEFSSDADEIGEVTCPQCGKKSNLYDLDYDFPAGYRLAGFEIIKKIGVGSTGNVYLATQLSMERTVAVKVLFKGQTNDKTSLLQFLNEVKTLGQIKHQNIVTAFESGEENGQYYLAMQYIPGDTLEHLLQSGNVLNPVTALRYAITVAEALRYVWNRYRLCHRDIKPGNIMIDGECFEPMLLDFGTAIRRGDSSVCNGQIEGSPFYMSPEQCRGEQLSFSSDIYSLGATLYHLTVGVPPYDDPCDVTRILQMHCESPFPPPETRRPGVVLPPRFLALLRRMMAKSAVDRFDSWEEVIQEGKAVLENLSGTARETPVSNPVLHKKTRPVKKFVTGTQTRMESPKAKSSWVWVINVLLLLALSGGIGIFFVCRNNTILAQNALTNAKNVFQKAKADNYEPDEALKLYRTAVAAATAWGVKAEVVQEIKQAEEEDGKVLKVIIAEKKLVRETHLLARKSLKDVQAALELTANALKNHEKPDDAVLTGAMDTLNETSKQLSAIPVSLDSSREIFLRDLQEIKLLQDAAAQLRSKLTALTAPVPEETESTDDDNEQDKTKEAIGNPPNDKNNDSSADVNIEAERKSKTAKYERRLAKAKQQTSREVIHLVRGRKFAAVKKSLILPDSLRAPEPYLKEQEKAYDDWMKDLRARVDLVEAAMKKVPSTTSSKAAKLELRKHIQQNNILYQAFLLNGYLTEAKQIQQGDTKFFPAFAEAYLETRILRAYRKQKEGDSRELDALKQDYGTLKEFQDALDKVRAK